MQGLTSATNTALITRTIRTKHQQHSITDHTDTRSDRDGTKTEITFIYYDSITQRKTHEQRKCPLSTTLSVHYLVMATMEALSCDISSVRHGTLQHYTSSYQTATEATHRKKTMYSNLLSLRESKKHTSQAINTLCDT